MSKKEQYPAKVIIKAKTPNQALEATSALNYLATQFDAKGIINIVKKFKSSPSTQVAVKAAASGIV